MTQHTGRLTISRVQSRTEPDVVELRVTDDNSAMTFIEVQVSLEEFASALLNLARRPCTFELRRVDLVGMKYEVKTELVPRPELCPSDPSFAMEVETILAPFEVDGWKARRSDMENHHRWRPDNMAVVGFRRYVFPEVQEEQQ